MNPPRPLGPTLYPRPPLSYGSHQAAAVVVALFALALFVTSLTTNMDDSLSTAVQVTSGSIFYLAAGRCLFVIYKEKRLDPEAKILAFAHDLYQRSTLAGHETWGIRVSDHALAIKPHNPRIRTYDSLCWVRSSCIGDWDKSEFFKNRADEILKLSYAICSLGLKELPQIVERVIQQLRQHDWSRVEDDRFRAGIERPTFANVISNPQCYLKAALLVFFKAYRCLRSRVPPMQFKDPASAFDPEHSPLFYQQGTRESEWRHIHNDLIDKLHTLATPEELEVAFHDDRNFLEWIERDEGPDFRPQPNLLVK